MPKEIALIFSDAHLQRRTWKHQPIHGDAYHSWRQIFDYALDHEILDLIGMGDLFDSRVNEPSPLAFAEEQFWRLRNRKMGHKLHYIQGQHELDDIRVLKTAELMGVAQHIHKTTIEIVNGMRIYGLDYQPADRIKAELDGIPKGTDVLVAHQVWEDFMGSVAAPQAEFADVPVVKHLWTGDYHQFVYETKKYRGKDGQRLSVLSPGATHQTAIDTPDECFFMSVTSEGKLVMHQLATRKFDLFKFVNNDQLEQFLADKDSFLEGAANYASDKNLPPELHKPVWRFIYNNRIERAEQRIRKAVGKEAHLFFKLVPETTTDTAEVVLKPVGKALTLESCLEDELGTVPDSQREAVRQLCKRLLAAGQSKDNLAKELANWKQQVLNEGTGA